MRKLIITSAKIFVETRTKHAALTFVLVAFIAVLELSNITSEIEPSSPLRTQEVLRKSLPVRDQALEVQVPVQHQLASL